MKQVEKELGVRSCICPSSSPGTRPVTIYSVPSWTLLALSAGSSRGFGGHQSDSSEEDDEQSDDGGLSTITEEAPSAADAATAVAHPESHQQPAGESLTSTDGRVEESQGTRGEAQSEGGWLGYLKRLSPWKPKDETVGQEELPATEQASSAEGDPGEESVVATEQGQIKKSWWSWLPWSGSSTDESNVLDIKGAAPKAP